LARVSRSKLRASRFAAVAGALLLAAGCGGGGDGGRPEGDARTGGTPSPAAGLRVPISATGWNTDWTLRSIGLKELIVGIDASDSRDLIPPLDAPAFEAVEQASQWLEDREPVVLLEVKGEARASQLRILHLA
jgi:hypothetical protein